MIGYDVVVLFNAQYWVCYVFEGLVVFYGLCCVVVLEMSLLFSWFGPWATFGSVIESVFEFVFESGCGLVFLLLRWGCQLAWFPSIFIWLCYTIFCQYCCDW